MPTSTPFERIRHVIVLMLENRSFDHMLGDLKHVDPDVDGIDRASLDSNDDPHGPAIAQHDGAATRFGPKQDIGHEPEDVATQIDRGNQPMSGFVRNFRAGKFGADDRLAQQVMGYFAVGDTPQGDALPALHGLARDFTVCDRWYSSVPGPTWPNRFFMLTGTSAGWAHMPGAAGPYRPPYVYPQETIFGRLADRGLRGRVYHGGISNVLLLSKMWFHPSRFADLDRFFADAAGPEKAFPEFAFIEPDFFGDDAADQHPPHDVMLGDALIARVYNAIRANRALWESSLFVVLYDEHGGFYDHVLPPGAIPPGDPPKDGFDFDFYGVRVPALLVSPWLPRRACHTEFDHTSVLRFVCDRWNLAPLGRRAAAANSLAAAFLPLDAPRADTVAKLTVAKTTKAATRAPRSRAVAGPELNALQEALLTAVERYVPVGAAVPLSRRAAKGLRGETVATPDVRVEDALARVAAMRESIGPERRPLRVLAVHGVGHGDENTAWQAAWRETIVRQVHAQFGAAERDVEIVFATYDGLFDAHDLSLADVIRALRVMTQGMISGTIGGERRAVSPLEKVHDTIEWTAGMALEWAGSAALRQSLRDKIDAQFAAVDPQLVAAHSLGALICYDLFRRKVVEGKGPELDGRVLLTFGAQLAHPALLKVFDGRIEPLHAPDATGAEHGFAHWYHLYNPKDRVFTRPLPRVDDVTTNIVAEFDSPDVLNHIGATYLGHAATVSAWAAIAALPSFPAARERGLASSGPARPVVIPPVVRTERGPRRALLIGINDYPDPRNRLEGCVNDVFLMSSVLQERGFKPEDIRVVLDHRATRQGVMDRMDWLVDGAREGDLRFLFYSGHGAQIPTYDEKAEPDGTDETLVLHDFDWTRATAFTDKEFSAYYRALPYGVHLFSVFDCCHSGGMTRGGTRVRGIDPPDDVKHRALKWLPDRQMWVARDFENPIGRDFRLFEGKLRVKKGTAAAAKSRPISGMRGFGQSDRFRATGSSKNERSQVAAARRDYGHKGPYLPLLLYACGEAQLAAEYEHGVVSYGAFTYVLAKTLRALRSEPDQTLLATLMRRAAEELAELGYDQVPELFGPSHKYGKDLALAKALLGGRPRGKAPSVRR